MIKIAPSILAADFLRLGEQVKAAEVHGVDRFHVDVMDGSFVPNISFGTPIIEAMRRTTTFPLETHLMIVHPERYLEAFAEAGSDTLIVHQETSPHLHRTVQIIKSLGKKAGVALNPSTPPILLDEMIEDLNLVLVMTVNPGFGGQHFIDSTLRKIQTIREWLDQRNPDCELEVDGGIESHTALKVVQSGARVLVAGTAIFGHAGGPRLGVESLMQAVSGYDRNP
jgi:ribulose-phosphate 3-epimerase